MATARIPLDRLFQRRLVDQICPSCGLREAGGRTCTACGTSTGLADFVAARLVELDGVVIARRNEPLRRISAG
jgi:hypothetical protein